MIERLVLAAAVASVSLVGPSAVSAEQQPWHLAQATQKSELQDRVRPAQPEPDVEELTPGQIQRAQEPEQPPSQPTPPKAAPTAPPEPATRIAACSGPFAPASTHAKLAAAFGAPNVSFTDVDGPDGASIMATVLYPKDAKRRLEVWWEDQNARSGVHLIVINGRSGWLAPKGIKLGLQLAAVEKLNGKPFKITPFNKDGGQVTDWQEGTLAQLPGGCKVGVRLVPDPKTSPEARKAVATGREFASSDAAVRALKPTIAEIILGF
jgi:hypothetical protein